MSLSWAEIRPLCILTQMSAPVLGPQQPMRSEAGAVLTGSCPLLQGQGLAAPVSILRSAPWLWGLLGAGGRHEVLVWLQTGLPLPGWVGDQVGDGVRSHFNLGVECQCGPLLATGQATPEHIFLWVTALSPP